MRKFSSAKKSQAEMSDIDNGIEIKILTSGGEKRYEIVHA
jgi:hypothetical protein